MTIFSRARFTISFATLLFLLSSCGKQDETLNAGQSTEAKEIVSFTEEVSTPADVQEEIENLKFTPTRMKSPRKSADGFAPYAGPIVNLGMVVWDVIKSNKPISSTNNQYANALPSSAKSAMDLVGFSDLQSKSYRIYGTNPYGATVYDVTYTLVHRYGGKYKGTGQYLENVTIIPSHVQVLWGYTFNMDVKASNPVNRGTENEPIAELTLEMKYSVSTLIKSVEEHKLFTFRGDSAIANKSNALGSLALAE